jgi:hypothetical protein
MKPDRTEVLMVVALVVCTIAYAIGAMWLLFAS